MIDEKVLIKEIESKEKLYGSGNYAITVEDLKKMVRDLKEGSELNGKMRIKTSSTKERTWEEIIKAAKLGRLHEILVSGDIIPMTLSNGDEVDLVVGFDEEDKAYFIFDKMMSESHVMNTKCTNEGGYAESEMAEYANNTVFRMLPGLLQENIAETKIVECLDGERIESKHKLFCLSHTQFFGEDNYFKEQKPEDTQIDIFKDPHARSKVKCGEEFASWWWLRSAHGSNGFNLVLSSGGSGYSRANTSGAVALGFCL